jgi:hypothetical protein
MKGLKLEQLKVGPKVELKAAKLVCVMEGSMAVHLAVETASL